VFDFFLEFTRFDKYFSSSLNGDKISHILVLKTISQAFVAL